MKKITFVVSNLGGGGTQRVTTALANAFSKKGYCVDLIVCYSDLNQCFFVSKAVNVIKLNFEKSSDFNGFSRFKSYFNNLKSLRGAIIKSEPDVIIAQQFEQCIRVPLSLLFLNKRVICCEHSEYERLSGYLRLSVNFFYKFFVKELIVLTEEDKLSYPSYLQKKIKSIGNPLCLDERNIKLAKTNSQRMNVVLSVGRLSKEKGFNDYILFIKKHITIFHGWKVKIVGSGPEYDNLSRLVNDYELAEIVEIIPFSNKVEEYYTSSCIYYLPSLKEGFGLVLLEAMELEIPIIAKGCSKGAKALIDDGNNGLLANTESELKYAFKRMMNSPEIRKEVVESGKLFVQNYYIENIIIQWENYIFNSNKSRL